MSGTYFVYILASDSRELYVGVTRDLNRRLAEHRCGWDPDSYSSRHGTTHLVYYQMTPDVAWAIRREKRLKRAESCEEDPFNRERKSELAGLGRYS
jgi:putative endonuclease